MTPESFVADNKTGKHLTDKLVLIQETGTFAKLREIQQS